MISTQATNPTVSTYRPMPTEEGPQRDAVVKHESQCRASRYPLSRWYLLPIAACVATWITPTRVRPVHITCLGLLVAMLSAVVLVLVPSAGKLVALGVLAVWFCDRLDGQLARRQQTATAWGAWLDANIDELVDFGLHLVVAYVIASQYGSSWPWFLLIAFLMGKYLLMYGLMVEENATGESMSSSSAEQQSPDSSQQSLDSSQGKSGWLRFLYHLPGNADVRVHLLVVALCSGWLAVELAFVAFYYNLRWIARYELVRKRLRRSAP